MKKIALIVLTGFFFSSNGFGQEFKSFDGSIFRVGDSIQVGFATGYNSYDYIKESYYKSKYNNGYRDVRTDISLNKYVIKDIDVNFESIRKSFYKDDIQIVSFGKKGFLGVTYYVDIENAIREGEIIYRLNEQPIDNEYLKDSVAYLYFVKSSGIPIDKFTEEYLFRYMNNLYDNTREDEFDYHNSLNQAKSELTNNLKKIDFNKQFSINTKLSIGNYNFENHGFLLNEEKLNFNLVEKVKTIFTNAKSEYPPIDIVFPNFEDFRFLEIEPDYANSFLKRRKDDYGNIDREVYVKLNFNIVNLTQEEKNSLKQYSGNLLFGKISSIEVYEYKNFKYNWLGTIKSN